MFKKDTLINGIITGLLYPTMFFVIFYELKELLVEKNMIPQAAFRLQFLYIISLVSNVIPAGSCLNLKKDRALKGVAGVTIFLAFVILIFFFKGLFTD